ncbi:MAG: DNA-binding transcriptional regulator [Planctomycetia bacterium]|nr:DNA-binding transcriptional regulator [Planctomycetia bacterium]
MSWKKTRIILLIETANEYGRGILRGIANFAGQHEDWEVLLTPGGIEQLSVPFRRWGGSGIIARAETKELEEALIRARVPLVLIDLSGEQAASRHPFSRHCQLQSNSVAIATMAFEHLTGLGLSHYGYAGYRRRYWSQVRQETFAGRVCEAGFSCEVFQANAQGTRLSASSQQRLTAWLRKLPKPIGIMACNDEMGRDLLAACWSVGIRVPEEVAVIGVDNDELLCDLCNPSLTSIQMNTEKAGFEAASLLNDMINEGKTRAQRIPVDPLWVVGRNSTRVIVSHDSDVARAIKFIHEFFGRAISVKDVVDHVAISRRSLELRFRKVTGHTLLDEIRQSRLLKAKRLLLETDMGIAQVARESGFTSSGYMIQTFRDTLNTTPVRFRNSERLGK